jgi:hypothetical protein
LRVNDIPENINYKKEYVFIHIPKNAGTSVYQALGMKTSAHWFLREYKNLIPDDQYEKMITIAFSRNPWDRFCSLYNYAKKEVNYYHNNIEPHKAIYGEHADYKLLCDASLNECAHYLEEGRLQHGAPRSQWLPQVEWLKNEGGYIEIPKFLGRVESLREDFVRLMKLLDYNKKLTHSNRSKTVNYRDVLDLDTRKIIERFYGEDIEFFKYVY